MTAISTRPPRTTKPAATTCDRSDTIVAPDITRTLALDAGNYDLKYWDGVGIPRAIRSIRFQVPQGRDSVKYSESSPLVQLTDSKRYHFGSQAYKYRRQQQTVVENKVDLAKLHLYACLEPIPYMLMSTCMGGRAVMLNGAMGLWWSGISRMICNVKR